MDLLRNYPAGYNVLPTANPHDVVNITLQMALYHIVDMVRLRLSEREISMIFQNERAQTMTTNCEVITKWHDVFLMWNPDDYDGLPTLHFSAEELWRPDILLYNRYVHNFV